MLKAKNFIPYLVKISQALETIERSSSKSGNSLSLASNSGRISKRTDRNLDDTIGESRRNADLQPLNKSIGKPLDFPSARTKTKKNMKMSHLKDRRLLNRNYGDDSRLRSFSRSSVSRSSLSSSSVI